jgi:hypothetical protein
VKTYLLAIFSIGFSAFAPTYICAGNVLADSTADSSHATVATTRFTVRLNSLGMFNYGGRIVSGNPSADFMYVREGRQLSIQAFKAFDLYDLHTDMNFAAAFLYKNLSVGKRLIVSPGAGFIVPQVHSIADRESDLAARLVLSYKVSAELTLEHTSLVTNLALKTDDLDWVNRFRITYSKKSIDASVSVWHNNKVFDNAAYLTTALSLTYARVRMTDHVLLNTGVTSVIMPYSNNKELNPRKNGIFITIAAVVH